MNKIIYTVTYTPPGIARQISDFMSKADLGIDAICVTEDWELTTSTKINKKYIEKMKKGIWQSIEKAGGTPIEIKYKNHTICQK